MSLRDDNAADESPRRRPGADIRRPDHIVQGFAGSSYRKSIDNWADVDDCLGQSVPVVGRRECVPASLSLSDLSSGIVIVIPLLQPIPDANSTDANATGDICDVFGQRETKSPQTPVRCVSRPSENL